MDNTIATTKVTGRHRINKQTSLAFVVENKNILQRIIK